MAQCSLRLVSINVARPSVLGEQNGEPVISAIAKKPVPGTTIEVGKTNLAGDAQANLEKHGGPDKAIYAYPTDNWSWWEKEHNFPCGAGAFGENLTLTGADEAALHIGDRFSWGDVVLEIAQPRAPCLKFQLYSGRSDAGALMTLSGRCGWYFRVLASGPAPGAGASIVSMETGSGPSVRETFLAAFDRKIGRERRREIAAEAALSEAWRKRLAAVGI